jgi:hypothetical protein
MSLKSLFYCIRRNIQYNDVVPHWSAVLISCNHSLTRRISLLQKTLQIKDKFFMYMNPGRECATCLELGRWNRSAGSIVDHWCISFGLSKPYPKGGRLFESRKRQLLEWLEQM